MDNDPIGLDAGQIDDGGGGNVETKQCGQLVERLVEDVVGSVEEPARRID